MNLYEINSALEEMINKAFYIAEETDGVIPDEISGKIELFEMERSEKIENTALLIKNIESEAEAIKAEEKRLADRRKSLENRAVSIREWLQMNLRGEKYSSARVAISYRKSEAVDLAVDPVDLPAEYRRVKTTIEADKTALKNAIKSGHEIAGVELVSRESMVLK